MKKQDAMKLWESLPDDVNPLDYMEPLPYKAKGSTFGACGIRIDGNPEFVDAVLGKLKDLIEGENPNTRLALVRNEVKPTEINGQRKEFYNAGNRSEVCYIRLHERGPNSIFIPFRQVKQVKLPV